jgi:hypothetical protein|tara:strand:+ start:322 stop:705 length:384 start_codon:yes stop_codon:yes gene_type:complete
MSNIQIGSNKSFGLVFFIFFLIIGIYPLINDNDLRFWSLALSLIFFCLGMLNSKLLTPLNLAWFKLGLLLGKVISPIIMGIIFFIVVTPIAILMKLFKKDLLNLFFNESSTYWIKKTGPKSKMKNQF